MQIPLLRQTIAIEPEPLTGRADDDVVVAPDIEAVPPAAFDALGPGKWGKWGQTPFRLLTFEDVWILHARRNLKGV
jgi:hypothetical protein